MGQTKRRIDREMEHGYSSINSRVCNHCVNDKYIKQFIKRSGEESQCDYCEKIRAKTVEFNEFIEFFLEHVDNEYGDPLEDLVNFEDGESFGIVELLFDLDVTEQESLRNDIEESLSDRVWCEKPYYQYDESDALRAGWEKFSEVAKKFRFTYHQHDDENFYEPIRPSEFLDALSNVISRIGLYKILTKGTSLYRVRIEHIKEKFTEASKLAPPPAEKAIYPNRMSPSGVPMFYGTFDIRTAIKETYSGGKEQVATVAKFKLLKDIILVDLSKIPPYLDFFEDADYSNQQIEFLNEFVKAISAPIDKDGREHIDYIPTQIITEHLRHVHQKKNDNEKIQGIIYPSSKSNGKRSVVIFCENEHCVEKGTAKPDSLFELESPLRRVNPRAFI
jgi:RES domain-containing protein